MNNNIGFVRQENPNGLVIYNTDSQITGIFSFKGKIVGGPFITGTQWSVIIDEGVGFDITYTVNYDGTLLNIASYNNSARISANNPNPRPQNNFTPKQTEKVNISNNNSKPLTPSGIGSGGLADPYTIGTADDENTFIAASFFWLLFAGYLGWQTYKNIAIGSEYFMITTIGMVILGTFLSTMITFKRRIVTKVFWLLSVVNLTFLYMLCLR